MAGLKKFLLVFQPCDASTILNVAIVFAQDEEEAKWKFVINQDLKVRLKTIHAFDLEKIKKDFYFLI